jgi:hypothetical protein
MVNMIEIAVLILATCRMASLLANEEGPGYLFEKVRYLVGVRYADENDKASDRYGLNQLARLILCPWCSSVWIGMVWALLFALSQFVTFYLALPFALSAGAILLHEWNEANLRK